MLDQCAAFIRAVPVDSYTAQSETLKGGTIGKHIRHTLDHFRAALNGTQGVIDYDHRERDVPMEADPEEALRAIDGLQGQLRTLRTAVLESPVRVRIMVAGDGTETELTSTLARELAFATHHAVHHQAMLGAMAGEFGLVVGAEFGKAPSTISYERARQ